MTKANELLELLDPKELRKLAKDGDSFFSSLNDLAATVENDDVNKEVMDLRKGYARILKIMTAKG